MGGPASPAEQVWWRNFHDRYLNQYVDQALQNNSDVLIARERINEYQAQVYAAEGSLFPSLDASVGGTRARTQSAATGLPIYSTLYKGSLTASYDVDIWGVNRSTAQAAQASLEAQKAAAAAADLTVASSVASGYVTLLALDEQLDVTQATVKSREDALNLAKRQYETGYSSRVELMQSDSELRSARANPAIAASDCPTRERAKYFARREPATRRAQRGFRGADAAENSCTITVNIA